MPAVARRCHGRRHVRRPVAPSQPPEQPRVERLRAHREAVDPRLGERPGIAPLIGPRVGLDRDLGVGGEPEPFADERDQPGDRGRRQQRRRPAADVEGVQRRPSDAERGIGSVRSELDLREECAHEAVDPRPGPACRGARVDHEVAVRAERHAERDVDVERNRGSRDGRGVRRRDGARASGPAWPRPTRAPASPWACPAAGRPPRPRCPSPSGSRRGPSSGRSPRA